MHVFIHAYDWLVEELLAPLRVLFVMRIMKIICMNYLHVPGLLSCGSILIYGTL